MNKLVSGRRFVPKQIDKSISSRLSHCRPSYELNKGGFVAAVIFQKLPDAIDLANAVMFTHLEGIFIELPGKENGKPVEVRHFKAMLKNKNLKTIQIFRHPIPVGSFRELAGYPVCNLRIRQCDISDAHLNVVQKLPLLRRLTIAENPKVTFDGLVNLLGCKPLDALFLSFESLNQEQREILGKLSNSAKCQLGFFARSAHGWKILDYEGNALRQ